MSRYPIGNGTTTIPLTAQYIGEFVPGVSATVQYFYLMAAFTSSNVQIATSEVAKSNGPVVLDGDHSINLNWTPIIGAAYYFIYKHKGAAPDINNPKDLFYKAGFSETSIFDVGYPSATRNPDMNPGLGVRTIGAGVGSVNGIDGDITLVAGDNIQIIDFQPTGQDITIQAIPSGLDTQVQFNDHMKFGANEDFTWDDIDKQLQIIGNINVSNYNIADPDDPLPLPYASYLINGFVLAQPNPTTGIDLLNITNINGKPIPAAAPPNGSVQFNNNDVFDGSGNLLFDNNAINPRLSVAPAGTNGVFRLGNAFFVWSNSAQQLQIELQSGGIQILTPVGATNAGLRLIGDTVIMQWQSNQGNVGIGLTDPAFKLDVTGDCNITGLYRVNGVPVHVGGVVVIKGSVPSAPTGLPSTGNVNGDAYISLDTGHMWIWDGTAWIDSGPAAGSGQTPWVSNIDGGGFSLVGANNINITGQYQINGVPLALGQNQSPWLSAINAANFGITNLASINGIAVSGMVQTPWASDINAANFKLQFANAIAVGITASPGYGFYVETVGSVSDGFGQHEGNASRYGGIRFQGDSPGGPTTSLRNYGSTANQPGEYAGSGVLESTRLVLHSDNDIRIFMGIGNLHFNIQTLPTSSAGLNPGDLWNNAGVVNIV